MPKPAQFYDTVCRGVRLRPPDALLNSWLLWQSRRRRGNLSDLGLLKADQPRGLWLWNSSYIATDLIKSRRQVYYGSLDPNYAGNPVEAMWLLENPWMARALFGVGFVLEAIAFLALANRKIAFVIGVALILMHRSIAGLMGLRFDNNDALRHLPGRPPFLGGMVFISYRQSDRALGRAHRNWHRHPAELFRPTRSDPNGNAPVYVGNLIESLDVWHNGRVTDFSSLPDVDDLHRHGPCRCDWRSLARRNDPKASPSNLEGLSRRRGRWCENKTWRSCFTHAAFIADAEE